MFSFQKTSIFTKAYLTISIGIAAFSALIYLLTVPIVTTMTYDIEEQAGRTILDNVYQLAAQNSRNLSSWRSSVLDGHKREMRNITNLSVSYIHSVMADVRSGKITEVEARSRILRRIRLFNYGERDYLWIADYNSFMLAHPDPTLNNRDFSRIRDFKGNLIVPPMVADAREKGEGYHSYWWNRLGKKGAREKLTYYKDIPDLKWVIGTGVYLDEVHSEVERRRQAMLEDLRNHLRSIIIARTGYIYIFDSAKNMIIHPNKNIEHKNISDLLDPLTGKPLADELIAVSQDPGKRLVYLWDKPSNPGQYRHEKISWVRYLPELDWYIASSVYTDELQRSARDLTSRLLLVTLLALVGAIIGAYYFIRSLAMPVRQLAAAADQISHGELTTPIMIERGDELGLLARSFNRMVERLQDHISGLELRVAERTEELSLWVAELELRNRETDHLKTMGEQLQSCRTAEEIIDVVSTVCRKLFPEDAGEILLLDSDASILEQVSAWGGIETDDGAVPFHQDDCWALRRGQQHLVVRNSDDLTCRHLRADSCLVSICLQMIAHGEIIGVLHICTRSGSDEQKVERFGRVAGSIAEHSALAIANLRLRETLQQQLLRDPLTGLYNRRFLSDALEREQSRARRQTIPVGLIMLDIDHFKILNDSYGHEAGDAVLQEFGKYLRQQMREEDIACRYGGEEFLLVLPGADREACAARMEMLRQYVAEDLIVHWQSQRLAFTISAGIAELDPAHETMLETIQRADAALYRAKGSGRNRTEVA